MTTQFDNVYHGLGKALGKIRFSNAGLGWKPLSEGSTVTIPADQVAGFIWSRVARNFQLQIRLKGDESDEMAHIASFENFQREDHDRLAKTVRDCYDKPLETQEISVRGWNWGSAEVDDRDMKFLVRDKLAFALPLATIANSNIAGRTEVSMEFLNPKEQQPEQNTGASSNANALPFNGPKKNRPDQLVEMRFYIPGQIDKDDLDDEEADQKLNVKPEEDRDQLPDEKREEEEEEEELSAAAAFHNAIRAKTDIDQVAGDAILVLKEVLVLTPRGRYDIDLFAEFLRLRGKTYDYKILYSSITQLFLLPKPDDIHVTFVIALEPPIRQGQTRYPFLVLQFPREEEMDAELNLDEDAIQSTYEGKLKKRYEEPTFRIVTNLFRVLSHQKVNVPTGFTNSMGQESVRCNVKANDGTLYPLNKSLIWVSKQTILVPYSEIHQLVFSRVGGAIASAKTFDLRIETRHGGDHTFQSIAREELDSLNNFFAERKLRIKNELADDSAALKAVDDLLDEDDPVKALPDDDDDDDDEEEDEDFEGESSDDGGSPSEGSSDNDQDQDSDHDEKPPNPKKQKT
ncbi:FACT complex subunit [Malassezia yamatoensis]|uniref:FACT complex subunit POB3 n=1 Tax=Malassezia yamatoensis TaxID=253288 RepID=A0AAJ5YWD6_9BASI|nr:FACT complex subunit [Malassezia yamatoensis]